MMMQDEQPMEEQAEDEMEVRFPENNENDGGKF